MKKFLFAGLFALASASSMVQASSFVLNEYNLITLGDVNSSSLHVHGNAFIGGNLDANNAEFGSRLENSTALELAGELRNNARILGQNNNAVVSGLAEVVVDQNGIEKQQVSVNNSYIDNTKNVSHDASLGAKVNDMQSALEDASFGYNALSDVNTQDMADNKLMVNSLNNGYAVFQLGQKEDNGKNSFLLNNSNKDLEVVYNLSDDTLDELGAIIINVPGTEIDFSENNNKVSGNSFLSGMVGRSKVVWNFFEATTLKLNANFYGNILAPLAQLSSGSDIDGSVAVYGISSSHRGQIHLPTPNLTTPTVDVPEPATLALLLSGLFLTLRRKIIR